MFLEVKFSIYLNRRVFVMVICLYNGPLEIYKPRRVKMHPLTYAPIEDLNQSARLRSLIRIFLVHMKPFAAFEIITRTCLYNFDPINPTFI